MSALQATVLAVAAPSPRLDHCRQALEAAGFRVVCVEDPEVAVGAAAGEPRLEAVLVDARLPGGAAEPLVARLHADERTRHLFVALVPADDSAAAPALRPCVAAIGSPEELIATLSGLRRFSGSQPEPSLLARLLDSAPDPILTVNAWGRIVLVNAQSEAVFGYSRQELLGQPIERLVPVRLRSQHPGLRHRFMSSAHARPMGAGLDLHAVRRDGSELPVEISLSPLEADGERFVTAVVRDVTDRRAVERALKENTQWLDAIFDASRDGIIVEDQERIIFANRATARLYGYDEPEELLGQHVSIVQAPEDNDRMLDFGRRRLAGEAVPAIYEFIGRRRDGTTLEVEASVASHTIGGRSSIITTVRDIAERKRADRERSRRLAEQAARLEAEAAEKRMAALYEDAREASRLKDEFLATLSHELRTPLNAMLGWARLLRGGSLDGDTRDRALESIERNARLQAQLVSDILDVSRIITGKLRLDRGPVDLVPLTQSGLDSIRPAADAKGVHVELHVEGELFPIHADGDRLLQVIWNLLSNAVKFTPPSGRVAVSLVGKPGSVEIRVSDTGLGICRSLPPVCLRPVPASRRVDDPHAWRPGPRPRDRQAPRGAPRRHRGGVVRRRGPGRDVRRAPACEKAAFRRAGAGPADARGLTAPRDGSPGARRRAGAGGRRRGGHAVAPAHDAAGARRFSRQRRLGGRGLRGVPGVPPGRPRRRHRDAGGGRVLVDREDPGVAGRGGRQAPGSGVDRLRQGTGSAGGARRRVPAPPDEAVRAGRVGGGARRSRRPPVG